jgi:pilus assembly protein CpaE
VSLCTLASHVFPRTRRWNRRGACTLPRCPMPAVDVRYYKTLLICPHKAIAGEFAPMLATALPLAPIEQVTAFPTRKQLVDLFKKFEPKLCVIDFASDAEHSFAVLADIGALAPEMPIIALLAGNNPDLILRCIRQGAAEFMIRPFTADQLEAAFEKIVRLHPPPASRTKGGRAIAVIPAKGASGATTIAANLAHQAKKNKGKVLLADLDPLTGTVSFLFKLKSTYSFLDILTRGGETVDTELWKQLVITNNGIDVLLPPEHLVEGLDELPEATPVIEAAQQIYETVIFDCGNPFGRWNYSVASTCDEVVLVTTNELASLQATNRILAWYEDTRFDTSKLRLVVNRYHREVGLSSESIGKALESEVFHVIPSDYETLQKAIMEGKPAPAGSAFGKAIAGLAERLIRAGGESEAPSGGKKKGLFGRG